MSRNFATPQLARSVAFNYGHKNLYYKRSTSQKHAVSSFISYWIRRNGAESKQKIQNCPYALECSSLKLAVTEFLTLFTC